VNYIEWLNRTYGQGLKENAADVYLEAFKRLESFDGDWQESYVQPWSDKPELEQWLEDNRDGLELFRKAARMEACHFPLSGSEVGPDGKPVHPRVRDMLFVLPLPHLAPFRAGIRGLLAEGYREASRGDYTLLRENAFIALRAARHLDRDPILLGRLVGIAGAQAAYRSLFDVLEHSPTSARGVVAELRRVDPEHPTLRTAILKERISVLDFLQRLFKPLPNSDRYTLVPQVAEGLELGIEDSWYTALRILSIGYEKTLSDVNRYFDRVDAWYRIPDDKVQDADLREEFLNENQNRQDILLTTLVFSLERARFLRMHTEATRRGLHLTAALLAESRLPASLPESRAPAEKSIHIDPYTGDPFVYRQTADGFTLYSVGPNRQDDGGQHQPLSLSSGPGDYVFWPRPER
jgi:hypothetical protein